MSGHVLGADVRVCVCCLHGHQLDVLPRPPRQGLQHRLASCRPCCRHSSQDILQHNSRLGLADGQADDFERLVDAIKGVAAAGAAARAGAQG